MPLPLLALAIAAFGIGTTEFVIMGLLPDVARDLSVSIPAAGMLVSGYALGVTIGAPIVAIATAKMPRKTALLSLMGLFIVGNVLCALAPDYTILMIARVITAFCHGAFFGIGSVVAAGLVAPHRRAQAIALMFTGLTLANVLGVPLGTALGQAVGWRATFWGGHRHRPDGRRGPGSVAACAHRHARDQFVARISRARQPASIDGAGHQRAGVGQSLFPFSLISRPFSKTLRI